MMDGLCKHYFLQNKWLHRDPSMLYTVYIHAYYTNRYTCIHTYIHTYIHTCTHVHIHVVRICMYDLCSVSLSCTHHYNETVTLFNNFYVHVHADPNYFPKCVVCMILNLLSGVSH